MARGGNADYSDRFFGAIVYLLALSDAAFLFVRLPVIKILEPMYQLIGLILTPALIVNGFINALFFGFGSLVLFFVLLIAVVQNPKISYFIRFNTMQSILIGIALSLIGIVSGSIPGLDLIGGLVSLVAIAACVFCIVQCLLGRRPDIPSFSHFVYNYVPR